MKYRSHRGCRVSAIGFGSYAASGAYGSFDHAGFGEAIERACELGINFFDTADAYGEAEEILGRALRPHRQQVHVATKVGVKHGAKANLSRGYIRSACEQSLRSLRTDHIDLYQIHFDDPQTPVAETLAALEELKQEGKIRHYGLGHLVAERIREYIAAGDPFSILMELSAVAPAARTAVLPLCQEHAVGGIAFSVTGRGLLTGSLGAAVTFEPGDIRRIDPLFQRERLHSGLRIAERMTRLAERRQLTTVQLAIAWVLHQPGIICALTGPTSLPHLEENAAAAAVDLRDEDLQALETLISEEQQWLRREQTSSVKRILTTDLPVDPAAAFVDLVYAVETALDLGLVREAQILPTFQELYALRQHLAGSSSVLRVLRQQLKVIIESDASL